jgi:hypothetical protein
MISSLQFLGSAMHILKRKNPLTESFLAQLEVDLEGTGIVIGPKAMSPWSKGGDTCPVDKMRKHPTFAEIPVNTDAVKCSPLFEIRTSQSQSIDAAIFRSPNQPTSSGGEYASMHSSVDIEISDNFGDFSAQSPSTFLTQLPSRSKGNSPFGPGVTFDNDTATPSSGDMDFSNVEKSRSNSYKDTSSHTSFTPPSGTLDDQRTQSHHSPPTIDSTPNAIAGDGMFLGVGDNHFANFLGSQMFGATPYVTGVEPKMPQGWDFGGVDVGTGLTPMSETNWADLGQNLGQGQQTPGTWGGLQSPGGFNEDPNNRRRQL